MMRANGSFSKNDDQSESDLKELMTAPPISACAYSAIQRRRIQARRLIEDAKESAALAKQEPFTEI